MGKMVSSEIIGRVDEVAPVRVDSYVRAESWVKQSKNEKKRWSWSAKQYTRCKDVEDSVDETELVAALTAVALKDYLSFINTQKGQMECDMLLVFVKEIVNEMSDLHQIKKWETSNGIKMMMMVVVKSH